MSKFNAVRTMFVGSSAPAAKVVVKTAKGEVRPAQSEIQSEIERLRAENAALRGNKNSTPKAKPVTKLTTYSGFVYEGHKCVRIEGNFAPITLSLRKLELLGSIGLAELIDTAKSAR